MFLIFRNNWIKNKDTELKSNQDKTVLPGDFYRLFVFLSGKDDTIYQNYSKSVLKKILHNRKCDEFLLVEGHRCLC